MIFLFKAHRKLNYSNERIYTGLIDLEPNANEIVAAAEHQEYQKRRQAAKFLVNLPIFVFIVILSFSLIGRISSASEEESQA